MVKDVNIGNVPEGMLPKI